MYAGGRNSKSNMTTDVLQVQTAPGTSTTDFAVAAMKNAFEVFHYKSKMEPTERKTLFTQSSTLKNIAKEL